VGLTPHFREDAVNRAAPLRYLAAALLLLGGLVHLKLYLDGYRDFPDENLGRSFLLNIVLSVVLAIAVAVRRDTWIRIAGIVLSAATLVAFPSAGPTAASSGCRRRAWSRRPRPCSL
jgi:hypothetical protein